MRPPGTPRARPSPGHAAAIPRARIAARFPRRHAARRRDRNPSPRLWEPRRHAAMRRSDGGWHRMCSEVGEGTGGGMMKHPMPGAPSSWLAYVSVDNIAAATAAAASLGATIFREVTEVPNAGSFSIIVDPTGAMLGLWQPLKK